MILPKLYSQTSIGQIQEWTIEVDEVNGAFRSHEGVVGGAITTSKWTFAKVKNEGKVNATTPGQQAIKEAQARWKKKTEKGAFEDIERAKANEQVYFKPQLAHKWTEQKHKIVYPAIVQPKLDGICNLQTIDISQSREGKKFIAVPHIAKVLEPFFKRHPNAVLHGELYNHQFKHNFNKIVSLVKQLKPTLEQFQESEKLIQYWIYDCYFPEMPNMQFDDRYSYLVQELAIVDLLKFSSLVMVENRIVSSEKQVEELCEEFISQGYEGAMVRNIESKYQQKRTTDLLKVKLFQDEEYEIVDIKDGLGNRSGLASTVTCKLKDGRTFDCGVIGNDVYTAELFKNKNKYIGKLGTVRYQNLTPDGIPRFGKLKTIRDYE